MTSERVVNDRRAAARDRKRLERERKRVKSVDDIIHETADWEQFLDPETLPRKACCQPGELAAVVLKELTDNAYDAGAEVSAPYVDELGRWVVADNGPGVDPDLVPTLFCVNRPYRSSKLKRLAKRGMLGNGLRVVMAWARKLVVETRGVRLALEVNEADGSTIVTARDVIPHRPGLRVLLQAENPDDADLSALTIALADWGFTYTGPSSPHWYGANDFANLFRRAPATATAAAVIRDLGLVPPKDLTGPSSAIVGDRAIALLKEMQARNKAVPPEKIGQLGPGVYTACSGYAKKRGVYHERGGGRVPFCIEAHVGCTRPDKRANADIDGVSLVLNRSASLAKIVGRFTDDAFSLYGCGAQIKLEKGKAPAGIYTVNLSLITPHVVLTTDGKAPALAPYASQIAEVVTKAMCQSYRRIERPAGKKVTQKAAASFGMLEAYEHASGNGTLSPNARQIMYASRGRILELTGLTTLDSAYITQTLLPNFES